MDEQTLWELFMTTGSPAVYLTLRLEQREQERPDLRRNDDHAHHNQGAGPAQC